MRSTSFSQGARRQGALPRRSLIVAVLGIAIVLAGAWASPARAAFPYEGTGGDTGDPYAYWEYMYIQPDQFPPSDLGGDIWKYSSQNACQIYGQVHENCDPTVTNNPQELFGVTGASIDKAWETTTGRPDIVLAVHDSGVRWNDQGAMVDLVNKTWLNRGELPLPNWGAGHPRDAYDRNGDGIFNMKDFCADPADEKDCGGAGDSRVRGAAGTADTDYNANGWIDPEDLIFRFSDGIDTDNNGYKDDFVGWDTYEDDNDPFDEVQYGHGTGEARDSTAEVNNGGDAGVCPNCMVMHMRVGDSFIADVNDFAQGVVYATDNGASVIQSALGTLNNSRFAQEAINYAYRRGVVLIASAADESAGHHNQPSVLEHGVVVNSIGEPELPSSLPRSYLDFRGCTNYGAYITAAVPSNSCSSEATGRSAGMAGLIYAEARNAAAQGIIADYGALDGAGGVTAGRGVSAEEVDQIFATTADDLDFTNYTARAGFGVPTERYPATEGWDPFFGYGRVNADRMVRAVAENKIPPEADITSPTWFEIIDPNAGPIAIEGRAAALRAAGFSYTVQWAPWSWRDANSAPAYSSLGVTLSHTGNQTSPVDGLLATIDSAAIATALAAVNGPVGATEGPAADPVTGRADHENRQLADKFAVIVRLEVTARDAAGQALTDIDGQPLTGIGTKNFHLHHDPALFPGFPLDLQGDGAAAPRFADIDNDGVDELIVATSNGEVHAYEATGGEVPGWPAKTCDTQLNYLAPGYRSGEITTPVHAAVLRSPAIGDLDRDGDLEVVVGDFMGCLSAFDRFGKMLPGFPARPNFYYSSVQRPDREAGFYAKNPALVPGDYPGPLPLPNKPDFVPDIVNRRDNLNRTTWWFLAAPTLANIDPSDEELEILIGAGDRHLYAFKAFGAPVPGWPVILRDPGKLETSGEGIDAVTHRLRAGDNLDGAKVIVSPAVGDIDGDGELDIVATVNEQYAEPVNSDEATALGTALQAAGQDPGNNRLYALHADGSLHAGGPPAGANHPNPNAYRDGWPARIASLVLELLPVVGSGPDGAPVLGNVDGGPDLEVAIFGTAGPAYVLGPDGVSIYGRDPQGRDRTLLMNAPGAATNAPDVPAIPAVGGGIFTDLLGDGSLVFAAPTVGLGKLLDVVLPEDQLISDNHLSAWDLGGSRAQLPAFPREVNDLQFLSTPASADIDGDGFEELLNGTAYSDLHAFNFAGIEPGLATLAGDGWPKFTAGWTVAPPSVGDFDGDGERDVAHVTREGDLFLWHGNGADVCAPASWPEYGHDPANTNNIETDARRPGAITDLAFRAATLTWTAPGDDGSCGQAASYEVRYSRKAITPDNFGQAALLASGQSGAAGEPQTVPVTGIKDDKYHFAVQVTDDAGNESSVSTVQGCTGNKCKPGGGGSLPGVTSGARPGPDVLYAAPPAAPQLENRNPRFTAAPLLVSGTEAYVAGEYLYQDYLYDDYGSDTDNAGCAPLSAQCGDIDYPTNFARYGNNAADIVEFRIDGSPTSVLYRITLNTLLQADSTIVAIAFDTDRNAVTGTATLPRDPGAPFPGTDEVIFTWGTGAEHVKLGLAPKTTALQVQTDLEANQITITVPRTVSNPAGVWRTTVAAGLYNTANGGWLRAGPTASATAPGGAGPLDLTPSGVMNLAFRFDEPVIGDDIPADTNQARALRSKLPTTYARDIDFGKLASGANSSTVPATGTQVRLFPSRLQLGEGRDLNRFPGYLGQLQPYSLYVPTTYNPDNPAGLTLNLHSLSEHYWQYNGSRMVQQIGEQRGNFVATSLSRGDDGWYQHEAEYDVFEMWADIAHHFALDPERVATSGYSMGGYATYRLGTLYPDLFGKAFTQVGPPGDGIWVPPLTPTGGQETLTNVWLENARNVPYLNLAAVPDELVPIAGTRAQNLGAPEFGIRGFDQLGYRFRFLMFPTADHLALAVVDDYPMAADFLGDAFVDRDPAHVTFAYVPATDDAALGLVHDHAYWVSGLGLADPDQAPFPAKGVIDVLSHGFGRGDPASAPGATAGTSPLPYAEVNRTWGAAPQIAVQNRLDVTLTNLAAATIDTARAAIDDCQPLTVAGSSTAPARLLLAGYSAASATGGTIEPATGGTALLLPAGAFDVTLATNCKADLRVTALYAFDADGKSGSQVAIAAVVRNDGATVAGATKTGFTIDQTSIGNVSTGALQPGEWALVTLTWNSVGLTGNHVLTAIADQADQVPELDEDNNARTRNLKFKPNSVSG